MGTDTAVPKKAILRLTDVEKSYFEGGKRQQVIDRISFSVGAGEVVVLRGPSGSGKSSVIRLAGLLTRPDAGSIEIQGEDVTAAPAAHKIRESSIGMVFQHSNLLSELTLLENLLVAMPRPEPAKALGLLERWNLAELANRRAALVSGGEAQRTAFCRALINDPVLLLADEPTSGLDDHNGQILLSILDEQRSQGIGVLVASHDPKVGQWADRNLEIRDGKLI